MKTLVSFGLCPFVQRSVITMNYKKEPFEVKYIDLANKPDWFLKLSPLGKVPILQVEDEVLFESAVINEYIDEVTEGSLLSSDPLKKAKQRAYIELASAVTMNYFNTAIAKTEAEYGEKKLLLESTLPRLLQPYEGPFFDGQSLSLVDTAVIPLLQRIMLTRNLLDDLELDKVARQKLNQWIEYALKLEEVKNSVPDNFEKDYSDYLERRESYIHSRK